jgi:hypothetical protein
MRSTKSSLCFWQLALLLGCTRSYKLGQTNTFLKVTDDYIEPTFIDSARNEKIKITLPVIDKIFQEAKIIAEIIRQS